MNEDRAKYNQYVENINKMLKSENFYADFQKKLKVARPVIKLNRKKRCAQRIGNQYILGMRQEEAMKYEEVVKLTTLVKKKRGCL